MIYQGDCLDILPTLEPKSIQCCVTPPPYYGLRDYGCDNQIGLEPTPDAYVEKLVAVFREVRRVLRDDGTVWLNLGDSYAANRSYQVVDNKHIDVGNNKASSVPSGLKPKDLIGIPWMVAFALRADGWYLRQDIIWAKPNPMPESVTDRCTKAHEYIFLLTKSARYFYDADAVKEEAAEIGGIIRACFASYKIPIIEMPISTWKSITGIKMKKASVQDKRDYINAVIEKFGMELDTTDEADAFLMFYSLAMISRGVVKKGVGSNIRCELEKLKIVI